MKEIFFPKDRYSDRYWKDWSWDISDIEVWATTETIKDMLSYLEKDERVGIIRPYRQQIVFVASILISEDEWYECLKEFMNKFNGGDMLHWKRE